MKISRMVFTLWLSEFPAGRREYGPVSQTTRNVGPLSANKNVNCNGAVLFCVCLHVVCVRVSSCWHYYVFGIIYESKHARMRGNFFIVHQKITWTLGGIFLVAMRTYAYNGCRLRYVKPLSRSPVSCPWLRNNFWSCTKLKL